jgi:hypothetical protein
MHCNSVETTSSDFLNVPVVFDSDVKRAIQCLKSTKSVGPDDILSFIIKGCSEIFVPVLKHVFNLSLSNGVFPSLWKEAAVVSIFKKGSSVLLTNYRSISLLNNFPNVFENIIHDQLCYSNRNYIHLNMDLLNLNQL